MLLYDLLPLFYHNGTHLCIKIWLNCLKDTNVYYTIRINKVTKVYQKLKREGEHNMENTMKMYVTADEAAQILGVSRGYAYKIIRGLNNELKEKGYRVISGKVPTKYFEEKFYGMAVG